MATRSLIRTIILFHLCALPFAIIAIKNIWLNPGRLSSYVLLIPAIFLLCPAYTDYLGEFLRRRREGKNSSNTVSTDAAGRGAAQP